MKTFKFENKNYEGKLFFGIKFSDDPETIYLKTNELRMKAIKNYQEGKIAKKFTQEFFKGLPFYSELNY